MASTNLLQLPLHDLLQDETLIKGVEEMARLYYSNSFLSISLYPAVLAIAAGILLLVWYTGVDVSTGGYGSTYQNRGDYDGDFEERLNKLQRQASALHKNAQELKTSFYSRSEDYDSASYSDYDYKAT